MNFAKIVLVPCLTYSNLATEKTAKPTGSRGSTGTWLYV